MRHVSGTGSSTFNLTYPSNWWGANVPRYINYSFERWTFNRHAFDSESLAKYIRAFFSTSRTASVDG